MSASGLPAEVQALIHGPLASMAHVETLLLLRAAAPAARRADGLATEAQIPTIAEARRCLEDLVAAGLAAVVARDEYRYAPTPAGVAVAVDALARMYNERPVTLVRAVYARPATRGVRAFSDAFRLRAEE